MKKNIKSKKLWDSKEIAAALSAQNTTHWVASGISIDSRRIIKGDLFIAIAGAKFDGNKYIGAWKDDKRDGLGICMGKNPIMHIPCEWKDGIPARNNFD